MAMVWFQGVGIEIKRRRYWYVLVFAPMAEAATAVGFHGQVMRLFLLLLMIGGVHLGVEIGSAFSLRLRSSWRSSKVEI